MLIKFAKTLALHREGILNYYSYRISTGPLDLKPACPERGVAA